MHTRALLDKARRTNARRDRQDAAAGLEAGFRPVGFSPDLDLRTIICAILSGMEEPQSWDCVAEAYEMAVQLHFKMTGTYYDPARSE